MQLNELLHRLKDVKRNGNQYVARCSVSVHDKGNRHKNPSLSVGVQGSNILLKCFSGCTNEDIVGALELEMRDLFITRFFSEGGSFAKKNEKKK